MPPSAAPAAGLRALLRRPAVLLILALLSLAALVSLLGRLAGTGGDEIKRTTLTSETGVETFASFSPDGASLAYSARGLKAEDPYHLFVRPSAGGAARQATSGDASDVGPVWSPDGASLAFARVAGGRAAYLVMPARGGEPRQVGESDAPPEGHSVPALSWTSDGAALAAAVREGDQPSALAMLPVSGGASRRLTNPPDGSEGDFMPAVAPDGARIAFVRAATRESGDVWTVDMAGGAPQRITFDEQTVRGVAWSADGKEIVYSASRMGGWKLWRVPAAGGSAREIREAPRQAQFPAVARRGRRLAYSHSAGVSAIWRAPLADPDAAQPIVRSPSRESAPSLSPDGKRIAFRSERSGSEEIWTAALDGSSALQLTDFKNARPGRPRWSPDGKTLVFDVRRHESGEVYTVPAGGGKPLRISTSRIAGPSFSSDGKWIYFGQRQVWRMLPNGGTPEQLSRQGGGHPVASPDGKWIYFQRARELWRMPAAGGEEERLLGDERNFFWGSLVAARGGVYFLEWDRAERSASVMFYDLKTRAARSVFRLGGVDLDRGGATFDISPDGKWIVFARVDQSETDVVLLEGYR